LSGTVGGGIGFLKKATAGSIPTLMIPRIMSRTFPPKYLLGKPTVSVNIAISSLPEIVWGAFHNCWGDTVKYTLKLQLSGCFCF
jgi:hypothetical protein